MVRAVVNGLRRDIPFPFGWRNTLILGGGMGAMLVTITLLLEPFGTGRYEASWRTLRIAGYGVCVVLPFLVCHDLDRLLYAWQGRRWRCWRSCSLAGSRNPHRAPGSHWWCAAAIAASCFAIHRSYLVNPAHVLRIDGNARKREAILDGFDRRLPISAGFDPTALQV